MAHVFTDTGKALAANRVLGSGTEPKFIAWGTGAGTAVAADTTLFTERTTEGRATGTSSRVTTTVTNDTYQVTGTLTMSSAGPISITNAGLFDVVTSSSGNLFVKGDHATTSLVLNESIAYTITLKFA